MIDKKIIAIIIITFLILFTNIPGLSVTVINDNISKDTIIKQEIPQKVNPGGLFISPTIGVEVPFSEFAGNSNMALSLGGRIEYSTFKLSPFVFAVSYYYQNHSGSDEYKTENLLNSLKTKIHNVGFGCDIILNKYIKQTFTIIFATFEVKYLKVQREFSPEEAILNIKKEDNVFGVSGGIGFTLYIFDIYGTYNYAKEYSSFSIKTRFRVPLIRF